MQSNFQRVAIAIALTILLVGAAQFLDTRALWGMNHLKFLNSEFQILFYIMSTIAGLLLVFSDKTQPAFEKAIECVINFFYAKRRNVFILAGVATLLLPLLAVETHFLGDGYGWLSVFGAGGSYIHKWTEPLSTVLVRGLQSLQGEYTESSALNSFRILSYCSGFIVFVMFAKLTALLSKSNVVRLFGLLFLVSSASVLLFFGYVEFYSMLWAAAVTFIYFAIKYLRDSNGAALVILTFLITVSMHLQALYFLPALVYLLFSKKRKDAVLKRFIAKRVWVLTVGAVISAGAYLWLMSTDLGFELIMLPIIDARPDSGAYAVFSPKHLLDIANQLFLIFPGVLIALALTLGRSPKGQSHQRKHTTVFLLLCGFGSVIFLFVIDPVIGLARDWDLFSLTLLPLILLCVTRLNSGDTKVLLRTVVPSAVVLVMINVLFLSTAMGKTASERRYLSLLRHYGSKDRSGWVILAHYWDKQGASSRVDDVNSEMERLFPDDKILARFFIFMKSRNYESALADAKRLYSANPYRAEFAQAMGKVLGAMKLFDSADTYYKKAFRIQPNLYSIRLDYGDLLLSQNRTQEALSNLQRAVYFAPNHPRALESLGLTHYRLGQLDSLKVYGELLNQNDPKSGAGDQMLMIYYLERKQTRLAADHFRKYKARATERSDYQSVVEHYSFLDTL
jgi:hypothetical protein